MKKIAVMSDSNCGLSIVQAEDMGVFMLPMPIIIEEKTYYENVDITTEFFYEKQAQDANVSSSQPSPAQVMDMWKKILKEYDSIVYIPMTSALSGSCQSAIMFANEFDGKVQVVDNRRISATQIGAIEHALKLVKEGKEAKEIKEILEAEALDASIYITVDTLKYLKKGGRITPAAAAVGAMLHIKPILTIQGEKLDACSKARGMKAAFRTMVKHLHEDIATRFAQYDNDGELAIAMANTYMEKEEVEQWKTKLQEEFPGYPLIYAPLTLSIGCHIGPGGLGIGVVRIHR